MKVDALHVLAECMEEFTGECPISWDADYETYRNAWCTAHCSEVGVNFAQCWVHWAKWTAKRINAKGDV